MNEKNYKAVLVGRMWHYILWRKFFIFIFLNCLFFSEMTLILNSAQEEDEKNQGSRHKLWKKNSVSNTTWRRRLKFQSPQMSNAQQISSVLSQDDGAEKKVSFNSNLIPFYLNLCYLFRAELRFVEVTAIYSSQDGGIALGSRKGGKKK